MNYKNMQKKSEAVKMYKQGGYTVAGLARLAGVAPETIRRWVNEYDIEQKRQQPYGGKTEKTTAVKGNGDDVKYAEVAATVRENWRILIKIARVLNILVANDKRFVGRDEYDNAKTSTERVAVIINEIRWQGEMLKAMEHQLDCSLEQATRISKEA